MYQFVDCFKSACGDLLNDSLLFKLLVWTWDVLIQDIYWYKKIINTQNEDYNLTCNIFGNIVKCGLWRTTIIFSFNRVIL